jgi:hypothetical protein
MLHAVLLYAQYATLRLTVWRYEPGPPTPAFGRSGEIGGDGAQHITTTHHANLQFDWHGFCTFP